MKKKEQQHLQHQLMLQQSQNSFPSPITPTYDKKLFSSPASSSSSSCRYDSGIGGGSSTTEVSSNASLYSSPSSSSASTPVSVAAGSTAGSSNNQQSQRSSSSSSSYGQYPFSDVYGSSGNFLSNSYASAAALSSHHDLSRSCSALPSPTIYPPTPPPSSTPWLHPAWFGSLETAAAAAATGYMKTPKNNPFEN